MKLDKERQGKANSIVSDIQDVMLEQTIIDKESFLSDISSMLCELDTDIAIEVMNHFGQAGEHQAHAIKVNYGY